MKNIQSVLYLIPKASYYNTKSEVVNNGKEMHRRLLEEDRVLYALLLMFNNATYYSKSLIMCNLLKNSLNKDTAAVPENETKEELLEMEDTLILNALFNENITHALKMLLNLKSQRINNRRTTNLILRFIFKRGNLPLIAIKYRSKLKDLLIHALGLKTVNDILANKPEGVKAFRKYIETLGNPISQEVFFFVFGQEKEEHLYACKELAEYAHVKKLFKNRKIHELETTKLPIEVLQGFNNFYKGYVNLATLFTKGNVSNKQKIQMQNAVKKSTNNTLEIKIDFEKYSIMDLFKYMYNKTDVTDQEIKEIYEVISRKSVQLNNLFKTGVFKELDEMAIILDVSDSNLGSTQSFMHPFYKNLTMCSVLAPTFKNVFLVGGKQGENELLKPAGHTDIATAYLDAVEKGFKNVIILSDGFENVNSFDFVYSKLSEIGYKANVIHLNPVFSPKTFSFKSLSDKVTAFPFSDEKDLENIGLFYLLNIDKEMFKEVMRAKVKDIKLPC